MQLMDGVGGSALSFHGPTAYRKPREDFVEVDGFCASQTVTVRATLPPPSELGSKRW